MPRVWFVQTIVTKGKNLFGMYHYFFNIIYNIRMIHYNCLRNSPLNYSLFRNIFQMILR